MQGSNTALNSRKSEILVVLGRTLDLGLFAVVSDLIVEESPRDAGALGSKTCAAPVVTHANRQTKTQAYFNCFFKASRPHKFANKYSSLVGKA